MLESHDYKNCKNRYHEHKDIVLSLNFPPFGAPPSNYRLKKGKPPLPPLKLKMLAFCKPPETEDILH